MNIDWDLLSLTIIAAILAYILNSMLSRNLEKSKIIYQTKLEAYEKIIKNVQCQLSIIDEFIEIDKMNFQDDAKIVDDCYDTIGRLLIMRDMEREMDSKAAARQLEVWTDKFGGKELDITDPETLKDLKEFLAEALITHLLILNRLYVHYGNQFNESIAPLKIMPSRVTVGPATSELIHDMFQYLQKIGDDMKQGEKISLNEQEFKALKEKLERVAFEMKMDLEATISGFFKKVYIHRIVMKKYSQ